MLGTLGRAAPYALWLFGHLFAGQQQPDINCADSPFITRRIRRLVVFPMSI
jgi:hypothetical protein